MGIRDQIKKQKNSYRSTSIRGQIQEMRQQEEALKTWAPQGIGDLKQAESKIPAEPKKSFAQEALYDVGVRPGAFFRGAAMNDQRRRAQGKDLYSLDAIKEGFNAGVNAFKNPEVATGENVVRGWGWEKSGPSLPVVGTPRQFVGGLLEMGSEPLNIVTGAAGGALATKVLPGLAKSASLLPRIGANIAKGAVEGGLVGGVDAYAKNRSIAQGAVTGAIGGGAIRGVLGAFSKGETPNSLPPRNETPLVDAEIIRPRVKTDFVGDQFGNVGRPIGGLIADLNAPKLALPPGRFRVNTDFVGDELGNVGRPNAGLLPEGADAIAQREFAKGLQPKNKLLPEVRKPMQLPVGESPINRSPGTMRPSNAPLKQALERYNEAMEDIQNYFGTHELRGDEIARIKPELGIDLDGLVKDIEAAEKGVNLKDMAERSRMAEVAGVKEPAKVNTITSGKYYSKLDELETAARQRIASRRGRLNSGVPIDDIADYALIGAAKMGKGAIRFSQWSAEMVAEHGEHIKPYLKDIYAKAKELHGRFKSGDPEAVNLMGGMKEQPKVGKIPTTPKAARKVVGNKEPLPVVNEIDHSKLKDISGFSAFSTDVYRNFENVYGPHFEKVKQHILEPLDSSKKAYTDMQNEWLNRLKADVVDKLGINKDSKLSAAVQRYGEGGRRYFDKNKGEMVIKNYTLDDLKREFPKDWQKVVEAEQWFRGAYKQLINQVNETRRQIYPNNPDKLVRERADYFHHFNELTGIEGIKNIFETPSAIDPELVSISEFTQPKSKFAGFMQKRGLGPYKEDAVGGFLKYIPAASYATHIDPHISVFAKLAGDLSKATKGTRNLNNFINFLRKYSQDLAGKTNPADRWIQEAIPGGRMTFHIIKWLNGRVKANVVLGNASSALSQLANIPQGLAFAKQHSAEGFTNTIKGLFAKGQPIEKSGFIAERYGGPGSKAYRQFDVKLLDQPQKLAAWVMETADKVGTNFIWNSAYAKARAEGVANAIKYADDATRRLVAGRGVGEVPLLQKSVITQVLAPFTLEVGNLWKVQGDFLKAKDIGALATLYVANFMFNKGMEKVKGSGVTFDPIQATLDAFPEVKKYIGQELTSDDEDMSPVKRSGRLVGEAVSNMPFGSWIAAGLVPEDKRKEFFGRSDPTRFGTGIVAAQGLQDPLYKLLPPFGGNQLKKTVQGAKALTEGAAYTDKLHQYKFPVKADKSNIVKGLLFGPTGLKEAKEYYDKNRRPLGSDQTRALEEIKKQGKDPAHVYDLIQKQREIERLASQLQKIARDQSIPTGKRNQQINELRKEIEDRARQMQK